MSTAYSVFGSVEVEINANVRRIVDEYNSLNRGIYADLEQGDNGRGSIEFSGEASCSANMVKTIDGKILELAPYTIDQATLMYDYGGDEGELVLVK